MAKSMYGSICWEDLQAAANSGKIKTMTAKNGKRYINIKVWINDTPDKFGNDASIQTVNKPEHQSEKNVYIGNLRHSEQVQQQGGQNATPVQGPDNEELPF